MNEETKKEFNVAEIKRIIGAGYDLQQVDNYVVYLHNLWNQINSKKENLNQWWMKQKKDVYYAHVFKKIAKEGLVFDGKHVTLNNRGISLDYVAYKNKMILAYPESTISFGIVYEGDEYSSEEVNGKVFYKHKHANPFKKDDKNVIGCYCVIRNRRGEVLKEMDSEEIKKHRAVASMDNTWKEWFTDMVIKTVVKKACKVYFDDVVEGLDEIDNEEINLEQPVPGDLQIKQQVEACKTIEEVNELYRKLQPKGDNIEYFTNRVAQLTPDQGEGDANFTL